MGWVARRRTRWVLFLLGSSASLVAVGALAEPVQRVAAPVAVAPAVVAPTFDGLIERQTRLSQRLKPDVRAHLEAAGREVSARLARPTPPGQTPRAPLDTARDVAKGSLPNLGTLANGDIEALAFIVLMEAARTEDADLRALLAQMKRANTSRAQLRQLMANRAARVAQAQKAADAGAADSLSDVSEEQQLRLQMAMDRISKLETTLSNILKKVSDTQSAIIQNMK